MRISVLGSGMVGRALSAKLVEAGHEVVLGTRNVESLLARTEPEMGGMVPPFREWHAENNSVDLATFFEAAERAEMIFNATSGAATLDVLELAGPGNLAGKVLVDVSNALDFSRGMPPSLFVCNTDSLAERIQAACPGAYVVKTLNTTTAPLMVNPNLVAEGDHHVFVSSDHADAKKKVEQLLRDDFGWKNVMDLGALNTARAAEMFMPMWLALMSSMETPMFNFKVVR